MSVIPREWIEKTETSAENTKMRAVTEVTDESGLEWGQAGIPERGAVLQGAASVTVAAASQWPRKQEKG